MGHVEFFRNIAEVGDVSNKGKGQVRRRKNTDISNDESTIASNSESIIKTSEKYSSEQVVCLKNLLETKKSKSLENIAAIGDTSTDEINKLKRSHGTCDIFGTEHHNELKCTKSLQRFCKLNNTNKCFLSYNAKVHDSATWSQALGRVLENPYNRNNTKYTSSTTQAESEPILPRRIDFFESCKLMKSKRVETKRIYSSKENGLDEEVQANSQCTEMNYVVSERTVCSKSKYGVTTCQQNAERFSTMTSFSSGTHSVEISEEKPEPSDESICSVEDKVTSISGKNIDVREKAVEAKNFDNRSDMGEIQNVNFFERKIERSPVSKIPTGKQKSQIMIEKQRVQVNMEFETVRNEEGFALLKYDMKSAGDHVGKAGSFLEMYAPQANPQVLSDKNDENDDEELATDTKKNSSSKTHSACSTDYEVVNLGQVDLLEEFKTTIANMRNVLDAIEVKKSIQGIIRKSLSEKKINQHITKYTEPNSIDKTPKRINTVYNQISTSTDVGFSSSKNKRNVVVQLTSDIISNDKTNSQALFNYIKPLRNVQKRKRRKKVNKIKYDKALKKTTNLTSSTFDKSAKTRMKHEKPQYNKCVVYHITQHKQAADRCVGTSLSSSNRESIVLHKTFSALHFGPIQEFPVLLNKHENEENRCKELKCKMQNSGISTNKKLTFKELKSIKDNSHNRSNTESVTTDEKKNLSNMGTPSTTANWFVFEPTPPLVVQDTQSTSEDTVLEKNSSSCSVHERPLVGTLKVKDESNAMNLSKYQACDKSNDVYAKDMPHITITVNVPIEEIVSKLQSSGIQDCDNEIMYNIIKERHSLPSEYTCDFGVQVNPSYNSNSLQTTPKEISRETSKMDQENQKHKDDAVSLKRLSSFKKVFGTKTIGFNTNPADFRSQRSSNIYFSDRSTSCPKFLFDARDLPVFSDKDISVEINEFLPSPVPYQKRDFGVNTIMETEGFFLNLPRNKNRKKREQISRLFNGSDSSDFKFFEDSKLLYQVHDSSFYSSSRTDNFTPHEAQSTKCLSSRDGNKQSFYPIHNIPSSVNIKIEPTISTFSEQSTKNESVDKTRSNYNNKLFEANETGYEVNKTGKGLNVHISKEKNIEDCGNQCDRFSFLSREVEVGINTTMEIRKEQGEREAETYFNIGEWSIQTIPKVRFEDEVYTIGEERNSRIRKNPSQIKKNKPVSTKEVSVSPLFPEIEHDIKKNNSIEKLDNANNGKPNRIHITRNTRRSSDVPQISSDTNFIPARQQHTFQSKTKNSVTLLSPRKPIKQKSSQKVYGVNSSGTCSTIKVSPNRNTTVASELKKNGENKNNSQLKRILKLKNFEKSRDSIVEMILYNLMREIIKESSEQLGEQGKIKVESIIANYVEKSNQTDNKDIRLVESAIQNLVKEIDSNSLFCSTGNNDKNYKRTDRRRNQQSDSPDFSNGKYRRHRNGLKYRGFHEKKEIDRMKRHHLDSESTEHHFNKREKCDISRGNDQQYIYLIEKVKELEDVTKQLALVQNQPTTFKKTQHQLNAYTNPYSEYQKVYPILIDNKLLRYTSKKRSKTGMNQEKNVIYKKNENNSWNIHHLETKLNYPIVEIPRNSSIEPVTKITINLSNWKSVCPKYSSVISDSKRNFTNDNAPKEQFKDKTLIFKIAQYTDCERAGLYHRKGKGHRKMKSCNKNTTVSENENSFTITIRGRNGKRKERKRFPIKKGRDYIKIKMTRKKLTSSSDHPKSDSCEKMNGNEIGMSEAYKITKGYVENEYALENKYLSSNMAENLLEGDYNIAQVLREERNLDLAYQRMANFCMFRGLLKKKKNF